MQLKTIQTVLLAPELAQAWHDTLAAWENAPAQAPEAVLAWALARRDEFLNTVREINDDGETLAMVVAVRFIELKSHWILLNTRINYATVFRGEADPILMYRASLVSQLLEALERLINERDVDRILNFLAEPINEN